MAPILSPTSPIQLPSDLNNRSSSCFAGFELYESYLYESHLYESYLYEFHLDELELNET